MIVDTSVWIYWLKKYPVPPVKTLMAEMDAGRPVYVIPPVLQEILQGAETMERYTALEKRFSKMPCPELPPWQKLAQRAALVYARCRWLGYTPGLGSDCMIAATCLELDLPLLHNDSDFFRIAEVEPQLKLVPGA